jgi:sodium transport system permease protein
MTTAARNSPPRDSIARVARLTLKELRESLRDRRTIVTLVLMPLLVYPLISLGFKQFLFANLSKTEPRMWRIAAENDQRGQQLAVLLAEGDRMLRQQQKAKGPANLLSESNEDPEVTFERLPGVFSYAGDLEKALRSGEIDRAIRVRPQSRVISGGEGKAADFELVYVPSSASGESLAAFVEERLSAINNHYVTDRLRELGDSGDLPAHWSRHTLAGSSPPQFQFAALVPMILILMTITGAVYPAIDLTAGERERGTLEALMAAPVPRLGLLFAKYIAVLTVALLTALVNMIGMTITLLSTGLGPVLFGEQGLTVSAVLAVFGLLVLFAAFFSAVLLCVTSFARSFKEAQAYLIPLMLLALAPGFLSLMPGVELTTWMSVAPLANIVLLARDTLAGHAQPLLGLIAVLTTALYGTAALGLAARIFGSDSILYGSQSGWGDLFRRPPQPLAQATLGGAMMSLALIVPLYVVTSGSLAQFSSRPMATQLLAGAVMLAALFGVVPLLIASYQGVAIIRGFQFHRPPMLGLVGAAVLGIATAPLAYELIILSQSLGIATLSEQDLADKSPLVQRLVAQWRTLPPALVLACIAIIPAVVEELYFRGYLLGAMRGPLPAWLAIAFTALVFGLFHASVGGLIATERVLSSMALGIVLGWVSWTTRSVLPGMLLHALNNSLVVGLAYWGDGLKSLGIDVEGQRHLPAAWLVGAVAAAAVGAGIVFLGRRAAASPLQPASPLAAEIPPP